jgi:response regulator RpfG family c-di-GMP phosphodiesterase
MTSLNSVLIVDDEPAVRQLMARWTESAGISAHAAGSAVEALELMDERQCDLAIVDIHMPGRDGLWLADEMHREHPGTAVVLATAHSELLDGRATTPPVADLMLKPFSRQRFLQAIDRAREWHERTRAEVEWHNRLIEETSRQTLALRSFVNAERAQGVDEAEALLTRLAEKLPEVRAHCGRVSEQSARLAHALDLDHDTITCAAWAGLLHDVGKLAIPEALLTSRTRLRPGELAIVRRQAEIASEILADTISLSAVAPIVRALHERFGGGGTPDGLSDVGIPVASRIVSVVDAYDAMVNDCSYRGRCDASAAAGELLRCTPSQFDPEIVISFLVMIGRP